MQYVHFLAVSSNPRVDPTASGANPSESIFEGHNLQELDPAFRVELSIPLSAVMSVQEAACPIGDCRWVAYFFSIDVKKIVECYRKRFTIILIIFRQGCIFICGELSL